MAANNWCCAEVDENGYYYPSYTFTPDQGYVRNGVMLNTYGSATSMAYPGTAHFRRNGGTYYDNTYLPASQRHSLSSQSRHQWGQEQQQRSYEFGPGYTSTGRAYPQYGTGSTVGGGAAYGAGRGTYVPAAAANGVPPPPPAYMPSTQYGYGYYQGHGGRHKSGGHHHGSSSRKNKKKAA